MNSLLHYFSVYIFLSYYFSVLTIFQGLSLNFARTLGRAVDKLLNGSRVIHTGSLFLAASIFLIIIGFISKISISSLFMHLVISLIHFEIVFYFLNFFLNFLKSFLRLRAPRFRKSHAGYIEY